MVSGNSLTEISYKTQLELTALTLLEKIVGEVWAIKLKNPVIKLDFLVHLAQFFSMLRNE